MKIIYDMSTGMVLEKSSQERKRFQLQSQDTYLLPELKLQEINIGSREEQRIPPELAIADLNAFLIKMS